MQGLYLLEPPTNFLIENRREDIHHSSCYDEKKAKYHSKLQNAKKKYHERRKGGRKEASKLPAVFGPHVGKNLLAFLQKIPIRRPTPWIVLEQINK